MERESDVSRLVAEARARGGAPFLLSLLEALRPIAPVLANAMLVAEPLAALWGGGGALRELADLLEEPDGFEALRRSLAEEPME
ncbi:MAG: hypothetical protein OXG84_00225 [Chloroflexi bacterium]|nr:hypothetical protein [Chloroflexota bacterium]